MQVRSQKNASAVGVGVGLCRRHGWMHWTVTAFLPHWASGVLPPENFWHFVRKIIQFCAYLDGRPTGRKKWAPTELFIIHVVHMHNFCTVNSIGRWGLGVRIIMLSVSPYNLVIRWTIFQWCSPRGQALASRRLEANFYGLGLGLGTYGLGLGLEGPGLGFERCINNFFAITIKLTPDYYY